MIRWEPRDLTADDLTVMRVEEISINFQDLSTGAFSEAEIAVHSSATHDSTA